MDDGLCWVNRLSWSDGVVLLTWLGAILLYMHLQLATADFGVLETRLR